MYSIIAFKHNVILEIESILYCLFRSAQRLSVGTDAAVCFAGRAGDRRTIQKCAGR